MGPTVTMLGGGVGCSRLAVPLAAGVDPGHLTLVVNTADDLWRYGLRICPDLDTNLYALAGMRDQDRGWGLAGDSFNTMGQLRRMGHDAWFNLGDLDLATHLLRTKLLAEGLSLSSLTARLAEGLGVCTRLLPMTDSEVSTLVTRSDGTYSFEEWFVKLKAAGPVEGVSYDGIEGATAAPGVLEAINDADLVVLGPSNPVSSVEPILSLPGVRDCLADRRSSVVAVTPIVDAVPIVDSGEAQR
ncbi:MAG: 2-phospho-L-lactate transferase, partial [Actinomycetia bacterium]|nr:2-phospho-L-lactate transferase [Actinomycetes bacterium]